MLEGMFGEIFQVQRHDQGCFGVNSGGQNMTVVRVGKLKMADQAFMAGDFGSRTCRSISARVRAI
jgi:hypothetical protein